MAVALTESLDKPFPRVVGFLFGNTELRLELWNVIAGFRGPTTKLLPVSLKNL